MNEATEIVAEDFTEPFVDRLDKATDIMAQHFAQRFVHLRLIRLAAETFTKLALNHREGGLNIRAFMIVLHKRILIVVILAREAFPSMVVLYKRAGG